MVFLAIDSGTDRKTLSFHQSRKLIPVQSVISNSRRFHSYSRRVMGLKSFYTVSGKKVPLYFCL